MNKVLITLGVVCVISYFGWKWYSNYSIADKLKFKAVGHYFKVNSFTSIDLSIYLDVTSELPIDIVISKYNIDIYINDEKCLNLQKDIPQILLKNTTNRIQLDSTFNPLLIVKNLPTFIKTITKNKLDSIVRLKGVLSVSTKGAEIELQDIPLDITLTIDDFLTT